MAKKKEERPRGPRTIATNRRARFDYHIEERYEAGIVLTGTEIKAVRDGRVTLGDGFVLIRGAEAWLVNVHIGHYTQGNRFNHEETRQRKLLLHKRQIEELSGIVTQKQWTIIPLRLYINTAGRAKVEIGLARGKQLHDKRQSIASRDSKRDIERALKQRY